MSEIKTYEFYMTDYSDIPGWEIILYTSKDVSGRFMSDRSCFIAALQDIGVSYSYEEWELFGIETLEELAIRNNLYVCFIQD